MSKLFPTAEEARQAYNPLYTLEEILAAVRRAAPHDQSLWGYDPKRMPASVVDELMRLGYTITVNDVDGGRLDKEVTISWRKE